MKLYLVRHGVSTGNTPGNLIGWSDHPLTAVGEAQAGAVAARLAPLGPMPVYSSDLPRALATAQHIAAVWVAADTGRFAGAGVAADTGRLAGSGAAADRDRLPGPGGADDENLAAVHADQRLREIDLGQLEGGSWDDFTADVALNAALEADPFETPLPGGESLSILRARVLAVVDEIVAAEGDTDAAVCLVAHDGPIRSILNHYLGVPAEKWWVVSTTHGGLSLLEFSDGWVNVRFVNDTAHLDGVNYKL
jgi:broad specificity phosphatase PhoE